VVFEADYDEFEYIITNSNNPFSDIITIMPPKNITKITSQIFSNLGPPIKIFGYANAADSVTVIIGKLSESLHMNVTLLAGQ